MKMLRRPEPRRRRRISGALQEILRFAQDDKRVLLYTLLTVAALARLIMQVAALPPYAGLDEVWHVARLAFVREEGRNPSVRENSTPRYLASSIANDPAFPADFGHIGERWPEVARAR